MDASAALVECRSLSKHFTVKTYDMPEGIRSMGYVASRKILATVLNKTKATLVKAVDGVDLEVEPGTWLGLLGPNGSGKTTLLKLLSALINPTSGSAAVMGYDTVTESEEVLDRVHFVPGLTTGCIWIDGTLTVRQNLSFMAGLYGFGKDDVDEAIHLVGLGQVCDQRTGTLSTGMTARMLLALGLLREVPVYLFDEPVIGLDPLGVRSFSEMIRKRIGKKKGVVIYASHMLSEIERTCDQVAFLKEGRIIAKDSIQSVKKKVGGKRLRITLQPRSRVRDLESMLSLKGIQIIHREDRASCTDLTVDTSRRDEAETVQEILGMAKASRVKLVSLTVTEASLEEVFTYLMSEDRTDLGDRWCWDG